MEAKINSEEISGDDSKIREYLIEHYIKQKKTFEELSEELDIDLHDVHDLLKKHDIPARKAGKRHKKK